MPIQSDLPQIAALKLRFEEIYGIRPATHSDFLDMVTTIENALREHVSESTLERLWSYSTRENKEGTVSLRTLNVLARFCGYSGWEDFCRWLKIDQRKESEMFEGQAVLSSSLKAGARLNIGWQPDRICILRYLGEYVFEVESAENTSLEKGDRFKVVQFQKGRPLYLEEFLSATSSAIASAPPSSSQASSARASSSQTASAPAPSSQASSARASSSQASSARASSSQASSAPAPSSQASSTPASSSDELSSGEIIASSVKTSAPIGKSYAVGQEHGLTTLQLL